MLKKDHSLKGARRPRTRDRLSPGADALRDDFAAGPEFQPNPTGGCRIVPVGKRRDGGTRYWCLSHRGDATAKYGLPAATCRYADVPPITREDTLYLDIRTYPGGIALWGAVPPVYDTTRQQIDRGIHVHARRKVNGSKDIDSTYRSVRILGVSGVSKEGLAVLELDAIYHMVTSVFGYSMKGIDCSYCGYSHLDKDWFSVHPHRRHLCSGCGKTFRDTETAIGNPTARLRAAFGASFRPTRAARRGLDIRQGDYPGGLQIWGSNPAIVWNARQREEEGIHVHAFERDGTVPVLDDTYSRVTIDGIEIDALMVRTLMAQSALPHISTRVVSLTCPDCGAAKFDPGRLAFSPSVTHRCSRCRVTFCSRGRLRKVIGNPLVAVLEQLASLAPRPPQRHNIDLLPETI
jgi:hypothetical protein